MTPPAPATYKRSIIETLPLLERLIFEHAAAAGIISIVEDAGPLAPPAPAQGVQA